ncbi:MAG: cache domain-containing protein, partial [Perlabentimonas sp.]
MRIKLKIRQKIFLIILSVSVVLYGIAIGYIVNSSQKAMLDDALQNAKLTARISADVIEKEFERDLALTRTLTQAFSIYQELPTDQWQDLFMRMYYPVLEGNEHVYSIWDSWEYYGFVPDYDKDHGRFCMTVWREDGSLSGVTDNRSLTGDPDKYGGFKQKNQEGLWEPYFDEVVKGKADRVLMTTVASPIQIDGRYMGLIGLDISLESLQEVVADIEPVPGSYAFLVSEKGVVAAHHNPELINTPLNEIIPDDYEQENLGDIVKEGEEHSYFRTDADGVEHYVCYAPIRAGNSYSSWSLALSIPLDIITERADENLRISLIVGVVGLFVLALVLMLVANSLTRPITKITRSLRRLRYGEISDELILNLRTGDEIETMSKALNISIEGLNKKTTFANDIGRGELESQLELLGDKDELGQALMNMRNSLKRAKEDEEKRVIEDKKRAWANEGHAKFAEILRTNNDNLQQLSDEVIQKLVKYLDGNQGALFLINDDDKKNVTLEAASVYAWDRKKFVDKQIMLGEGLVGACALEHETIFLTEIPENFVTITSGLGEANPNCILLVPLKQDENVLGVIEIASFKIFEKFEVEFL